MTSRHDHEHRITKETDVEVDLVVDGVGKVSASTGIPFFDHMLEQLGKHGGFDLDIAATGDLEVDTHHTVEDVGIVLGTAFKKALGDKAGVRRFASGLFPLDEALVQVAVDLSGRPFVVYEVDPVSEWIGTFDPQLAEEFWRGFAFAAGHHPAPAVALRQERPPRDRGVVQGCRAVPARCGAGRGSRAPVDEGHPVDLFPAIDLRDGNAVRLLRGEFAAETVYDADPVAVARRFEADGARWIHVVDLDAARTGEPANLGTVAAIARAVECPIQVGGGVRDTAAADALIDAGVRRVVVGTAAVEDPDLVDELCHKHPDRVAVGLDARGQEVAVRGWVEGSGKDLVSSASVRGFRGLGADRHRDRPGRHARRPRSRPAGDGAGDASDPRRGQRRRRHARRPARARRARGRWSPARGRHRRARALRGALHGGRGAGGPAAVSNAPRVGYGRPTERHSWGAQSSRGMPWMQMT